MITLKCRVKAAKCFPEAATNLKLANNDEVPTVKPTSHTVNDPVVKEPEFEGKTNEFINELTHFTTANDNIPQNKENCKFPCFFSSIWEISAKNEFKASVCHCR